MAAYALSGTLAANVVTSVIVAGWPYGINVVNRSGTGTIWVRMDGVDPTVAGQDCFPVLGARNFPSPGANVNVRLISSGALDYTVEGQALVLGIPIG